MDYNVHFKTVDAYLDYTNGFINSLSNPIIKQKQIGFVVISAVTAYELTIKEIFINFANKKHKLFGIYVENIFERINGRIKIDSLKKEHIKRFGDKYVDRFNKELKRSEDNSLKVKRRSIISSYGNIITWRNRFVHEGIIVDNASYEEAVQSYQDGKEVIYILSRTMVR